MIAAGAVDPELLEQADIQEWDRRPRLHVIKEGDVICAGNWKLEVFAVPGHTNGSVAFFEREKNVLFSGTIRENLQWGNPDASDTEIWNACHTACADEFIRHFPDGLDTRLEQGGINLSGGQKQRLCIARTPLKHPKIQIFDDSTSAIETATEEKMRRRLSALSSMTKLVIAQRATSVMHAHKILILVDGHLHALGTPESLLASCPVYQEIYDSQMRGGTTNGNA